MQSINTGAALVSDASLLANQGLDIAKEAREADLHNPATAPSLAQQQIASQNPVLEPPKAFKGGFYESLITALASLAGVMGEVTDSMRTELNFKRVQMREMLKDKLRDIDELAERKAMAIKADKEMQEAQKREGIFGRVINFAFAAAEMIAGAATFAAGVIAAQPSLIAGGAMLVTSGALEMTAEIVDMTGGSETAVNALKGAATASLVIGIGLTTFGGGTAAATTYVAKKGARTAAKEASERAAKELGEKAAQEGGTALLKHNLKTAIKKPVKMASDFKGQMLDNSAEFIARQAQRITTRVDDIASHIFGESAQRATQRSLNEAANNASKIADDLGNRAASNSDNLLLRAQSNNAQRAASEASQKATKHADDIQQQTMNMYSSSFKNMKNVGKGMVITAGVAGVATGSYGGALKLELSQDQQRMNEIEQEIAQLQAALDDVTQRQDHINKLINLIQEYVAKAVSEPVTNTLQIISDIIHDNKATASALLRHGV